MANAPPVKTVRDDDQDAEQHRVDADCRPMPPQTPASTRSVRLRRSGGCAAAA